MDIGAFLKLTIFLLILFFQSLHAANGYNLYQYHVNGYSLYLAPKHNEVKYAYNPKDEPSPFNNKFDFTLNKWVPYNREAYLKDMGTALKRVSDNCNIHFEYMGIGDYGLNVEDGIVAIGWERKKEGIGGTGTAIDSNKGYDGSIAISIDLQTTETISNIVHEMLHVLRFDHAQPKASIMSYSGIYYLGEPDIQGCLDMYGYPVGFTLEQAEKLRNITKTNPNKYEPINHTPNIDINWSIDNKKGKGTITFNGYDNENDNIYYTFWNVASDVSENKNYSMRTYTRFLDTNRSKPDHLSVATYSLLEKNETVVKEFDITNTGTALLLIDDDADFDGYGGAKINSKEYDSTQYRKMYRKDYYKYDIYQGWNMLAMPVYGELNTFDTFDINSSLIYTYDAIKSEWIKNPQTLKEGEGFWLRADNNRTAYLMGEGHIPDTIKLEAPIDVNEKRWFLLGTGQWQRIKWLKERDSYIGNIFAYQNDKWLINPEFLEKGQGFWVSISKSNSDKVKTTKAYNRSNLSNKR